MAEIRQEHDNRNLGHHLDHGTTWLAESAEGENTVAMSYAAFELRLATERLAVHYWFALLNREVEATDLQDIQKFDRIQNRIYQLGGHQKEIDAHFDFMRIMHIAMKLPGTLHTPQIGQLARCWHDCSEFCHIAWPIASSLDGALRRNAFQELTRIVGVLQAHVESLGWPIIQDPTFLELRNRFVAGEVSAAEVLEHLTKTGIWAKVTYPDGRPAHFVGEAIPPNTDHEIRTSNEQPPEKK